MSSKFFKNNMHVQKLRKLCKYEIKLYKKN